jgi:hypothetical protein
MDVLLIFLGSILTFVATLLVERWKSKADDRRAQRRYAMYGKLQLGAIRKILDKMRHSYENGGSYQQIQRDINLLEEAVEPLNNFRNDTTMLDAADKQANLVDIIADLNLYALDVKGVIVDEIQPLSTAIAEGTQAPKMTTKHIELIELCRRVDEIVDSLKIIQHNKK